jgi:hypothetical protein
VLTLSVPFVATRVGKEDEDYSIKAEFVNEKYNMSAFVHREESVDLPTYPVSCSVSIEGLLTCSSNLRRWDRSMFAVDPISLKIS